ncbi:MAG TPA: hypothetical protein VFG21_03255 [Xanthomonadaceae bacterium]|nr:hypothetical protein [Xanthomonadaceae bacterium]
MSMRPVAFSLALILAGQSAGAAAATAPGGDVRQAWREYTRQKMAPAFSWAGVAAPTAPTAISRFVQSQRTGFDSADAAAAGPLSVSRGSALTSQPRSENSALGLLGRSRSPIAGEYLASTIESEIGEGGRLSVTGLFAHQRYASADLGFVGAPRFGESSVIPDAYGFPHESSTGGGVRVGYTQELDRGFEVGLALQSRIDMDPFETIRGVYGDPGDFDLPGRVEVGMSYALTPALAVRGGVERIFYSDVPAFTSAALPTRLLSLLGDGTSPAFAWRDLTVYSLATSYVDRRGGEWTLRWSTSQQPEPTSALLLRALEPGYTDRNLALSYSRELGTLGRILFAASYAPARYFLGPTPYIQSALDDDEQLEIEALWSVPF